MLVDFSESSNQPIIPKNIKVLKIIKYKNIIIFEFQ